jgi:hydrogenase maturation protein HypF
MTKSLHFQIRGTVQGVGFRPWIYRLARQSNLKGFVQNTSQGVCMEIEGPASEVENFVQQVRTNPPAHCVMTQCLITDILPQSFHQFRILPSQDENQHEALVLPDIASCPDCIKEIFDKHDRRYLYPFTNCTHCGPRYSIIEGLPYDRLNTSMKKFKMCRKCQDEYDDPLNRRFHAQPNACPVCGPKIALWDDQGDMIATNLETLPATVGLIKRGMIVAVKALGGFYLMADALNADAVALLRERKARPHKPLALMMPSLRMVRQYCQVSSLEGKLLQSPQAPIVLLRKAQSFLVLMPDTHSCSSFPRKRESMEGLKVTEQVAPQNPYLGCMLPSMPLLHILLRMLNRPLVATSGNLSEEPLCIDNAEALDRLKGIADFFLVHDRPIVRHVDDSIVQVVCEGPCLLRRARGFAPLPIEIGKNCDGILATGAHQKNTVALGLGTSVIVSQHIGDLNNKISCQTFEETIGSLKSIYDAPVTKLVCDAHPDYASSRYAHQSGPEVLTVQHHHAHVASCMAERGIAHEVLGVCWDGTGYGHDGTVWGGEFLITDGLDYHRIAHLNLFPLPGGEQAVKEPRRSALGLLFGLCDGNWQEFKDLPCVKAFDPHELIIIQRMIKQNINTPMTSSMGRLFDGIASIIGLCHQSSFEGQAAMALEFQASENFASSPYSYKIVPCHSQMIKICHSRACPQASVGESGNPLNQNNEVWGIDWFGIIQDIIEDLRAGRDATVISTRFHQTLIEIIIDVARQAGQSDIVLTGGCFQNKWLLEGAVKRLKQEGFNPYWHKQIPTNDGGISLGQMFVAARRLENVSGNTWKN